MARQDRVIEAAERVLSLIGAERPEGENPLATLGWELGEAVSYEHGLELFAKAVIEITEAEE